MKSEARVLYVATDKYPYIEELETHLKDYKVGVWIANIGIYYFSR